VNREVFITGARGLVCRSLSVLLRKAAHEVIGVSRAWGSVEADRIETIIHCAADIRFGRQIEEAREVCTCQHGSTPPDSRPASSMKSHFPAQPALCNAYEPSKFETEQIVLSAARDLRACIFRLSSIIGDSRVEQWNYFHHFLRLAPRARLVPGIRAIAMPPSI
jgi:nucleoside-diphosphate-sugar epimerase